MAKQIIHLRAEAFGFKTVIAKVRVSKLADEVRGDWQYTDLVCPRCNQKPSKEGREVYKCSCGFEASTWQKLKRVIKGTLFEVVKQKLGGDRDQTYADLYKMRVEEFAHHVAATKDEHGITLDDEASALNLFKLLVGAKIPIDGQRWVIIVFWNDTYEEKIALLTTLLDGTIILREIIPRNLALLRDVCKVDEKKVTKQDIEAAKALLMQIPEAKQEMFDVDDYRKAIAEQVKQEQEYAEHVQDLNTILEKAKTEKKPKKIEVKAQAKTKSKKGGRKDGQQ